MSLDEQDFENSCRWMEWHLTERVWSIRCYYWHFV